MLTLPTLYALGTHFWIEIFDEQVTEETLDKIFGLVQGFLTKFENDYSRFTATSLISRLNTSRELLDSPLELAELLRLGVKLYDDTNGIFNLLIGETLAARGYDAAYTFTAQPEPAIIPNPHESLSIETDKITLTHGQIDIGGYGKGYAIDAIVTLLKERCGIDYFLINGGGDMYGTSDKGTPITIYLEHPIEPETYIGRTTIFNNGFAASSHHKRRWRSGGKTYHHIVDTKGSGMLASDASFITAPSALLADVFGTVALLANTPAMNHFATKYELGVANFIAPSTLTHNQHFNLQILD